MDAVDFIFVSSDIVKIIFDLYYLLHSEWLNQNITIQIANSKEGEGLYLDGCSRTYFVDVTANPTPDLLPGSGWRWDVHSPIWRMYPHSESGGFLIRGTNIEAERFQRLDTSPRYLNNLDTRAQIAGLSLLCKASAFQLVQSSDCGNDEYYFQNTDNGKYLAFKKSEVRFEDPG